MEGILWDHCYTYFSLWDFVLGAMVVSVRMHYLMDNRKTNQQLTAKLRDKSSVPDDALIHDLVIFHVSSWFHWKPTSFFVPKT